MKFTTKEKVRVLLVVALLIAGVAYLYYPEILPGEERGVTPPISPAPQIDPASVGKIVTDKETGKEFLSNQVIVEFAPEVLEEGALAIIAKHNGTMVAHFTKAPVYLVQVEDAGDGSGAKGALMLFQAEAQVKKAELNFLTVGTQSGTLQ